VGKFNESGLTYKVGGGGGTVPVGACVTLISLCKPATETVTVALRFVVALFADARRVLSAPVPETSSQA